MANEATTTPGSPRLLHLSHPVRSLTIAFGLWKALIFLIVIGCPGPGYDTSTGLLPYLTPGAADVISRDTKHAPIWTLLKFTRWDSIYFVHIAERGYVFEQEWAFGYGYTRILAFLTSGMFSWSRWISDGEPRVRVTRNRCLLLYSFQSVKRSG